MRAPEATGVDGDLGEPSGAGDSAQPSGGPPSRARRVLVTVVPFLAGWVVTVAVFSPGHATGDTAGPYLQALGRAPLDNWHPTANTAIYWVLTRIWEHPAAILIFQTGVIWAGLAGISFGLQRVLRRPTARYVVPLAFMPFVFIYVGVLMKDTLSLAFTLVAIALLVIERTVERGRLLLLAGAAVVLIAAYLVKISVLPIVIALLVYIALQLRVHRTRRAAFGLAAAAVVFGGVVLRGTEVALDEISGTHDAGIEGALQIFDLTGIAKFSGENVFGEDVVPTARLAEATSPACYDPGAWDPIAWWGPCSFVTNGAEAIWDNGELAARWRDAILDHPANYLTHRLAHIWAFSVRPAILPSYYDFVDERLDWTRRENVVMDGYQLVIDAIDTSPLMRPVLWQAASVVILVLVNRRRRAGTTGRLDGLLAALMIGNLLFYAALAVIGVASEFRYSSTVVVTCLLAALVLALDRRDVAPASASTTAAVAVPNG